MISTSCMKNKKFHMVKVDVMQLLPQNLPFCRFSAAILVNCLARDWIRICYVTRFENIRIHQSTCYRIRCGFIFSTLENGFENIRISLSNSPDAFGRSLRQPRTKVETFNRQLTCVSPIQTLIQPP